MIIFDLDGTLADCDHRRDYVDPAKRDDCFYWLKPDLSQDWVYREPWDKDQTIKRFKPNWKGFFEACDKDKPIEPVIKIITQLLVADGMDERFDIKIWSGRCESVREKTLSWLQDNIDIFGHDTYFFDAILKMRPIGDSTPDDQLKEKWLDEAIAQGERIEFVFDDRPKVVRMWRRRGIFVFNCAQHDGEF